MGPYIPVTLEYRVPIEDFLNGTPHDGPTIVASDARNIVTDLMRRSWEAFVQDRGLKRHSMAGAECWYVPPGLLEKDKAKFRDINGKAKWRAMGWIRKSARTGQSLLLPEDREVAEMQRCARNFIINSRPDFCAKR
jgi:hypothetical protein